MDTADLLELALEENDESTINEVVNELESLEKNIAQLEFRRMFSGEYDSADCYVDLQSGSGGTEAQDWTEMLLRMYLRWAEKKGFKTELMEVSDGDVAGIKSATIRISGEYAFGWLRTETGIHRLVRKSPFDSNNRRHTSFSAVFVYPEIDDDIDIEINPADLRIDVYRASGAGGQHVNRTESAVRITHIPSGIVVQCQNDRSQHKNKDQCMKQLRAKLYEMELQKKNAEKQAHLTNEQKKLLLELAQDKKVAELNKNALPTSTPELSEQNSGSQTSSPSAPVETVPVVPIPPKPNFVKENKAVAQVKKVRPVKIEDAQKQQIEPERKVENKPSRQFGLQCSGGR